MEHTVLIQKHSVALTLPSWINNAAEMSRCAYLCLGQAQEHHAGTVCEDGLVGVGGGGGQGIGCRPQRTRAVGTRSGGVIAVLGELG